ncbi:hypothetical protein EYB53_024785 [Candidatus Chloroploca sp. M-50]|uniref:Transposase IS4-like domain-containing protein n=1 Tax=Candidatus Chloroploca mongolica TaxID=2528176 RepID=A0ABS4DHP5_9CHLR|nr:transposase [Candidatus Chloroploca mongolica]MBP1468948.1 hypothetical protein [Candidatus Chloroploca mongolica]
MPTSPLYDSIHQQMTDQLVDALTSQLTTLALIVVAVSQCVAAQLGRIARAMPVDTTQSAKEQRLRRFLDNDRMTQETHYHPIVRRALQGLKGQRVHILIDRVLIQNRHNILVVSVGFRRRSIPLTWIALDHRGPSGLEDQQAVVRDALALLPPGVRVSIHGDSEFRSQALFAWVRGLGHDALLGVTGRTLVADTRDGKATSLEHRMAGQTEVVYLNGVYLTEDGHGPVNVIAWWDKDPDGKILVRAVMTNLPANGRTYRLGKRRMWIETVFRDWQSGGFHLDRSGLEDRQRFARLLLPLVIAYLWFVAVGRWVVKRGYRKLVDDGPARSWKYSLFQLGVAWKERMASFTQAIPVLLALYL